MDRLRKKVGKEMGNVKRDSADKNVGKQKYRYLVNRNHRISKIQENRKYLNK